MKNKQYKRRRKKGDVENSSLYVVYLLVLIIIAAVIFGILNSKKQENITPPVDDVTTEFNDILDQYKDTITVTSPKPNDKITSPLTIEGEAVGWWFFEASFPVMITDWDGKIIAESYVTAQDEWMTEEKVPFLGTIEFDIPEYGENGWLILQRDDPSDGESNDSRPSVLEIPINFE